MGLGVPMMLPLVVKSSRAVSVRSLAIFALGSIYDSEIVHIAPRFFEKVRLVFTGVSVGAFQL